MAMNNRGNGHRKLLVSWLNDAYAMEQSLIPILENHANDAADHPHVAQRIRQHIDETKQHAEKVRQCVERLGSSTSAAKTAMSKLMGQFKAISTGMHKDELVKNNLADIAAEQFEVACYHSLATAARDIGESHIAQVCEEIMHEDQEMADWLHQQLPRTTVEVLHEVAAGQRR